MAICLDYQSAYTKKNIVISVKTQIIVVVMLLAALLVKIAIKMECIEVGYELASARKVALEYDMDRREAELELSVLTRPDNLSTIAKRKLGLGKLAPSQARVVTY